MSETGGEVRVELDDAELDFDHIDVSALDTTSVQIVSDPEADIAVNDVASADIDVMVDSTLIDVNVAEPLDVRISELAPPGPPGPPGPEGPVGPQGPPGTGDGGAIALFYPHPAVSNFWVVNHNLHFYPAGVVVEDSAGTTVEGDIDYIDTNTLTISFSFPFAGAVYLS